ncbi:hypothetical protein FKM82_023068 [Ascaphus truei]
MGSVTFHIPLKEPHSSLFGIKGNTNVLLKSRIAHSVARILTLLLPVGSSTACKGMRGMHLWHRRVNLSFKIVLLFIWILQTESKPLSLFV